MTPNTAELYSAQIPALATLMSLGWHYLSPADCLAERGGNAGLVLRSELVNQLRKRRFDFKGESFELSTNAIDQLVRELSTPVMHEGLLTANEKLYNALTLGLTVTEFVGPKKTSVTVPVIDWQNLANNSFIITEELEVFNTSGTGTRRPDLVAFVNGIPLVVIEAKRPDSGNPNSSMWRKGLARPSAIRSKTRYPSSLPLRSFCFPSA